ncbi:Endoribonuclease L-PSP [Mycena alexandri]|uniref:Endoribonuclease L-PSP n=1 Tax=Mycena alexandri TaxID=1745969 RepID=A0AAD6TKQ1_9AGAR|nr:Endoribonuclease L-PSP [Mycena alexandri]
MSKKIVFTKDAVPPMPVFSQATIAKGIVYCSGNIGCTNEFVVVEGGVKAQTRRALENLSIVLKAAGSGLEHIVKANIYLTDMNEFVAMNEVYLEFFDKDNMPARTGVAVAALPLGARFEVECTAVVPDA